MEQLSATLRAKLRKMHINIRSQTRSQYQALDPATNEIRLLRIFPRRKSSGSQCRVECSLFIASLDTAPMYKALSYTWGDSTQLGRIRLDGHDLIVTSNLGDALHQLQSTTEEEVFWIDALCINQKNSQERNEQVSKMRTIYKQASGVVIWFGPHDNTSELAFRMIERMEYHAYEKQLVRAMLEDSQNVDSLEAIAALLKRDYWYRVWVIQEVHSASWSAITIRCGSHSIAWSHLQHFQEIILSDHEVVIDRLAVDFPKLSRLDKAINHYGVRALELPRQNDSGSELPNMYSMLTQFWYKSATDPRDKIYALVGLTRARDDSRFCIDYSKSVREVFLDVAKYIITSSQRLEIICSMPRGGNKFNLPSWVPDWTVLTWEFGCPALEVMRMDRGTYSAAGTSGAEIECMDDQKLMTKGFRIDKISSVGIANSAECLNDPTVGIHAMLDWFRLYMSSGSTDTISVRLKAIGMTLLLDSFERKEGLTPESRKDDLEEDNQAAPEIFLSAISHIAGQVCGDEEIDPLLLALKDKHQMTMAWAKLALATICEDTACRRFFITGSELIGIAPDSTQPEDIVCILLGCSWPVVLRQQDGHWILIGAAYVHGYMYGKGMEELNEGKFVLKNFEIH